MTVGDGGVGDDHRAGGDEAFLADSRAGEEGGGHADEGAAADELAVDDGAVADHYVVFDDVGDAGIAVNDGLVLDIDALADGHGGDVAADDGVEPDAGLAADADVADDGAVVGAVAAVG